jgi:predicted ATP-grasp superfamily ATP-dependent carboligase
MGEKLNEHPVRYGTATLARSIHIKEIIEPSKKLLKKLNYTGISEVEWILNDQTDEYNLIEINPRTWLWIELAKACGKDFVKMMYTQVYQKELCDANSEQYQTDVYWYNPITYYPFKIIALFSGVSVKSPKGRKVNALFIKGDSKPGWMYLINLFNIFRRR